MVIPTLPPGILGQRLARKWLGDGDFARLFNACVEKMVDERYSPSTISLLTGGLTHFLYWFKKSGRTVSEIDASATTEFIDCHLAHCNCAASFARTRSAARWSIGILLKVLRNQGRAVDPISPSGNIDSALLEYDSYLKDVCGLAPDTRRNYLKEIGYFLASAFGHEKVNDASLTAAVVRRFIRKMSARRSNLGTVVVALRSYLKFKAAGGMEVAELLPAIPKIAQWRLARLPKILTRADVAGFLSSFDRSTDKGLRDYAIARCLTDLGLRAREAALLRLDDIDWRSGIITLRSKGQKAQTLPLTHEVGSALSAYICKSRRKTSSRAVFMRVRAPFGAADVTTIRSAMRSAARRSGLGEKIGGTHIFRHTFAARLLDSGATLNGIADLLGHTSFDTTRIYTKVDMPALRGVAMPWIGKTV